MNKMVKGAIATGVGVILLVGGGGTLATWNASSNASMGSVVSGDLNLTATNAKWTNAVGTAIPDIAAYKVVPGDVLTYTQDVNITLSGDLMAAKLAVTGVPVDGTGTSAFGGAATVSTTTLTKGTRVLPDTILTKNDSGVVKASTTFTFRADTAARTATNASFNLSGMGYSLVQQAPATAPATVPAT